jgi:hypothetical protein
VAPAATVPFEDESVGVDGVLLGAAGGPGLNVYALSVTVAFTTGKFPPSGAVMSTFETE